MVNLICSECGVEFKRNKSASRGVNVFCGRECYTKELRRRNKSTRVEEKEFECSNCGESFMRLECKVVGRNHIYCSRKCTNLHNPSLFTGENHPRWNFNLTKEDRTIARKYPEYREWRLNVFKRDRFACTNCRGNKGGNIQAHHIINYSDNRELRTEVSNGVTLCEPCHKDFHGTYGYTGNNGDQLAEFYAKSQSQHRAKPVRKRQERVETTQ